MSLSESKYDGWLDRHFPESPEQLTVVELGCGRGDDTSFLLTTGHRIISCDISGEALGALTARHPGAETRRFDMRKPFPIETAQADIVTASLCLHFFGDREMAGILSEIRRILKPGGQFLCRLNSTRDRITGRAEETELGPGLYMTAEGQKRFYDEPLIRRVFSGWRIADMREYSTVKFSKTKSLWELVLTG